MNANPVLKPKLATPALVFVSVAIIVCLVCLVATVGANLLPQWALVALGAALLLAAASDGAIWLVRGRRVLSWMAGAQEKWKSFDEAKRRHGTTAEVTVLSVDALEPTGSWITIKWDRFDHTQAAWLAALPEPIWSGTVLLISPDPAQVMPGLPWPTNYYIHASHCLAWAPAAASSGAQQARVDQRWAYIDKRRFVLARMLFRFRMFVVGHPRCRRLVNQLGSYPGHGEHHCQPLRAKERGTNWCSVSRIRRLAARPRKRKNRP